MIRIVTDTASDLTLWEAEQLNIDRINLDISFDNQLCPMDTPADYDLFYERLKRSPQLPLTSRPAPEKYLEVIQDARRCLDEVLVITLSSGLSGTYESACLAREMAGYPPVQIVDCQTAVMAQRILVEHACRRRAEGASLQAIAHELIRLRERVVVMGVIGSLEYLKRGGRIPPALALVGSALGIKPVITVTDGVIQPLGKARGQKAGEAMILDRMAGDRIDPAYPVIFGYTSNRSLGESFMNKTAQRFSINAPRLCQVSGVIGTHLGTDSAGVAYVKN